VITIICPSLDIVQLAPVNDQVDRVSKLLSFSQFTNWLIFKIIDAEISHYILRKICGEYIENAENNDVIYRIFCGE
jgi:hypothetical protein